MGLKQNYTLLPKGEEKIPVERRRSRRAMHWFIAGIFATSIAFIFAYSVAKIPNDAQHNARPGQPPCPQFPALKAQTSEREKFEKVIKDEIDSDAFFDKSLKKMQGAVQIPTESFDDMGPVGNDSRWDVFKDFHAYLEESFPLVYSKLKFTPVNTYGILLDWKGSDESLKPYLFMGHQDVVPVPLVTQYRWRYPPYSAHYDGRFIWGRGATDCKNVLIGVLEAFETLLENDYTPERTILAGFGFDEEISGYQGAQNIAQYLEQTRGKDSIDLLVDEGGLGITELNGATFALPGLGEKGYFDVRITVETAGGHSSVPPDHTSIGILSRIVATIEDNPYEPDLTPTNPYFTTLQCTAEYSTSMDKWLKKLIQASLASKKAARTLANYLSKNDIYKRYLMQTSQATDIVSGGVKINALPEKVYAIVNYRIAVESRIEDVQSRLYSLIQKKILPVFPGFSIDAWGDISGNKSASSVGSIILEDFDSPLEPSPVSPFDTDAYKTFTGTIKQVMGENVVVAPSLMTGNTDTRFYWGLTKNIYRFAPVREGGRFDAHTVDERVGMKEHIEGIKFYAQMVLNGDQK